MTRTCLTLLALLPLAACGEENDDPSPPPAAEALFPADFRQTYQEVRDCRASSEHDLSRVRIFADALAQATYESRTGEFAEGALLVKEQYDGTDSDCEGPVVQWTVMQRLAAGSSPDTLDWKWQRVNDQRQVMTENDTRCAGCHSQCGDPPDGYGNTCALP